MRLRPYFVLLLVPLSAPLTGKGEELYALEEYTWDNPAFREKFIGTYGTLSPVEPRLSGEDGPFLREEILPLMEDDPEAAEEKLAARLEETTSPALYFVLGNLYLDRGDTERAEKNLKRALSLFPDFRRAYRSLALSRVRAGDFEGSIPLWREVIRLGGGDDQSFGLMGYGLLQEERWAAAALAFENALLYRPQSRDLRRGLTHALLQSGRWAESGGMIRELLREEPENADLWKLRANHLLADSQIQKAAAALEVAMALGNQDSGTFLLAGNIYLNLNQPEQAARSYMRALETPETKLAFEEAYPPLEHLLDRSHWEQVEAYSRALRLYFGRDLEADSINRLNAATAIARLATDPGPEIAETTRQYADHFPLDGRLHLALARYYENEEQMEEALLAYRRAASDSRYRYEAKLALANVLVREKRYEEAIRELRELQQIKYTPQIEAYIRNLSDFLSG